MFGTENFKVPGRQTTSVYPLDEQKKKETKNREKRERRETHKDEGNNNNAAAAMQLDLTHRQFGRKKLNTVAIADLACLAKNANFI